MRISGQVVEHDTSAGIADVLVELLPYSKGSDKAIQTVRTNRYGIFTLLLDNASAKHKLRISDGHEIVFETRAIIGAESKILVEVTADDLGKSLVKPTMSIPVIRDDVFTRLSSAIARLPKSRQHRALTTLKSLEASLPPIASIPEVTSIAARAMRSRDSDVEEFRSLIEQFALWAIPRRHKPYDFNTPDEAEKLVSAWAELQVPADHVHMVGVVLPEAAAILAAAAAIVDIGNSSRLIRNLRIMHDQLSALGIIDPILREGDRVLAGIPGANDRFISILESLNNLDDWPFPPVEPDGWLPGLDDIPWVEPPFPDLCDASVITALLRSIKGVLTYQIDKITPEHACPGQVITIEGSGFRSPGFGVVIVVFPGLSIGTDVLATPTSVADDIIEVVVPQGAASGRLWLQIDAEIIIEACGSRLEFTPVASSNITFNGGVTAVGSFRMSAEHCAHAGDTVVFSWNVSNANELQLVIDFAGPCEVPQPNRIELDPADNSFSFLVPSLDCHTWMTATLIVHGACGEDTYTLEIGIQAQPAISINFLPDIFTYWHNNLTGAHDNIIHQIEQVTPNGLDQLVAAVATVTNDDEIGVMGSGWSFTDCVAPEGTQYLIKTDLLNKVLDEPPFATLPLRQGLMSVLSDEVLDTLQSSSVNDRLLHVEAGIKLHRLNCELECRGLALPSLGGDNGQSIAGAINTGTHGANPSMPPISDQVRAIHLIGPGGQQWWIEPDGDNSITDPDGMEDLKKSHPDFAPCLYVVYDDELFRSCLVAFGSAGVVYSVVIEAVPAHQLESTTISTSWDGARAMAMTQIINQVEPIPWWFEITVNPTRQALVTTRDPTFDPPEVPLDEAGVQMEVLELLFGTAVRAGGIGAIVGLGTGALAALIGVIPFYVARRIATYLLYLANPFMWWRLSEISEEIELVERLARGIERLVQSIVSGGSEQERERRLAAAIPDLLNAVWQIGFYIVAGRTIVEAVQNIYTMLEVRRPGNSRRKSYIAMTSQVDCDIDPQSACSENAQYPVPNEHPPLIRLIHSHTFVLPADMCLGFVEAILAAADTIRASNDAVIVIASIRFTRGTRAFLGMQQFDLSGHVELYTIDGMAGNAMLYPQIEMIASASGAIPHWGQVHPENWNLSGFYGDIGRWRNALDRIAIEGGNASNVFRHSFARNRGILGDL